jgi:hypothetical protein
MKIALSDLPESGGRRKEVAEMFLCETVLKRRSVQSQADSGVPTFKATAKPNKTIMFSVPCSGTENWKSSALFIRLHAIYR